MDGGFWGFGLGFASFVSILPLFVGTLTRSAVLICLIPAIQNAGQQLPQLFLAGTISRQRRLKPMLLWGSIVMRLPFLGLGIVALSGLAGNAGLALWIVFALLITLGLASGVNNAVWLSFIRKLMPARAIGSFIGAQAALANLLAAGAAVLAGVILAVDPNSQGFGICFVVAFLSMSVSLMFLGQSREAAHEPQTLADSGGRAFWQTVAGLLRADRNFSAFLLVRFLLPFASMAFAFYSVFAVWERGLNVSAAGGLAAVLMVAQVVANPILGWLGDKWSHRNVLGAGLLAGAASAGLAVLAPGTEWFWLVFALAGITFVASWTTIIALTMQFGTEANRPLYIGMSNTLTAPGVILAPILGGVLADRAGYPVTFLVSAGFALLTVLVLFAGVRDPERPGRGS
jgi:hypothetical protein